MKKEMLKKMKMPEAAKDPMLEIDESDARDMAGPGSEVANIEMPNEPAEGSPAAELSSMEDKDLIDELKKRGYEIDEQADAEQDAEEMDMGE